MNQRIEKMAEQCRSLYRDGNGGYIEQFDEQKFAELIVRECAKFTDYQEELFEHFGVEE